MNGAATRPARHAGFWSVQKVLWLCLVLQGVIGLAVVFEGSRTLLPDRLFAPAAPDFVPGAPVAPDDQRRRFRPADLPGRPGPVTGPETPRTMPETLVPELAELDGRRLLRLTGAIDEGAADRVRRFLENSEPEPDGVSLHSPGGLVHAALEIGTMIRNLELPVAVEDGAICMSACPYMLAGGTERLVSEQADVGVHQSYYDKAVYLPLFIGVSDIQRGEAEAMRFLIEMGVDPLVRIPALETPPADIYLLTEEELLDYRLATEITTAR